MKAPYMASGRPDPAKRRCFDCRHCKAAVSWWCTDIDAVAYRGTAIPGVSDCQFWAPVTVLADLPWWKRLLVNMNPFNIIIDGDAP